MRIVMMGTGSFAVPTFQRLLKSGHEMVALVTRPPRGKKPPPNPMKVAAEKAGLPIEMPDRINDGDAVAYLRSLQSDLFVVCDFGQILSNEVLGLARLGGINLHGSLLPAYRGAAPVHWAIYDGHAETGITVIHMTAGLDAGPSLAQVKLAIDPHENALELEHRLAAAGVDPVLDSIERLATWNGASPIGEPQEKAKATKAPRLKKQDGSVDWSRSARQIYNQYRAFTPWPGTFTFWHRPAGAPLRVVLKQISPSPVNIGRPTDDASEGIANAAKPGTVVFADKRLVLATGDGQLEIVSIQPAGKKSMDAQSFLRGYPISIGDTFGTT